jgi:AraC-like DNA-binding protein
MSRGRAKLAIGEGVSAWVLEAPYGFGDAGYHAHHAIQISVCLEGELVLETGAEAVTGVAMAVAADAQHRIQAHGMIGFLFVEPESAIGRTLTAKLFEQIPLARLDRPDFINAVEPLKHVFDRPDALDEMLTIARSALELLAPVTCLRRADERVQRIIDFASTHLDEPLTLEKASAGIYLSGDRLRHLFVEQTGLAFRTYVLWLRLIHAVQLYSKGMSLTEAAHSAGFADSAHFSRIFKRHFGLPATTLTRL